MKARERRSSSGAGAAGGAVVAGAEVAGTEAAAGLAAVSAAVPPLLIAEAALTVSFGALVAVTKSAADSISRLASAASQSGPGSAGNISRLSAYGISPEEVPGAASALRSRLGSDPYAIAAAGYVPPLPFGPTNNARILEMQFDRLRGLQGNPDAQFRQVSTLGLTQYLDKINVSPGVAQAQRATGAITQQIFDPQPSSLSATSTPN